MELVPGVLLGSYQLLDRIGAGGMGEVWRAKDTLLGRVVALKVLSAAIEDQPVRRVRFEREARAASALTHPGICTIHSFGEHDGRPYLVMEFVDGETLRECLDRTPVLELYLWASIGVQVAEALSAAHAKGIVHRDIKPANLISTPDGVVKVLDFGIAKAAEPSDRTPDPDGVTATRTDLTATGATVGTVAYMSPEQVRGEPVDGRSDIFALGAVLYEAASGRQAFPGATSGIVFDAILNRDPLPLDRGSGTHAAAVEAIVFKALAKSPGARYPTSADMAADLRALSTAVTSGRRLPGRPGRRLRVVAAIVMLAALLSFGAWRYRERTPAAVLTDKDTIVLAAIANATKDPVFDQALRQALHFELSASPFISVVSDDAVRAALSQMQRPEATRIDGLVAREVCQRTSSKVMLETTISELGARYVLGLTAINCLTGDVVAAEQEQAESKELVIDALANATRSMRRRLGESLASIETLDSPVLDATTPSLDALQLYALAVAAFGKDGPTAAIPLFERAVEVDPDFVQAHLYLSLNYWQVGRETDFRRSIERAYALRATGNEIERLHVEAQYAGLVTEDLEEATQLFDLIRRRYPRDRAAAENFGFHASRLGRHDPAAQAFAEAWRNAPDHAFIPLAQAEEFMALGRYDEARRAVALAEGAAPGWMGANGSYRDETRIRLAFAVGDRAEVDRVIALHHDDPDKAWWHRTEAMIEAYDERTSHAWAAWKGAGPPPWTAGLGTDDVEPIVEAELGDPRRAALRARSDLTGDLTTAAQVWAALVLARSGDPASALQIATALEKQHPAATLLRVLGLPAIRGAAALAHGRPEQAIRDLEPNVGYELAVGPCPPMYPVYLRGLALLDLNRPAEAAREFQKIIDARGFVLWDPVALLARRGLDRATRPSPIPTSTVTGR